MVAENPQEQHHSVGIKKNPAFFIQRPWLKLQQGVYYLDDTLGPYVKRIIPNFAVAHYVYILTWVFICAIALYAGGNMSFANAVFFGSATATQSGLNTINLNSLYLYQQIIIYVTCILTTNIFVHSSTAFIRLYWYEKTFHNIKQKSMANFKTRRAKTIAALTERSRVTTMNNPSVIVKENTVPENTNHETKTVPESTNHETGERCENNISFGSLPKPQRKQRERFQPSEVLLSINMMRNNLDLESIDSGPALHIASQCGETNEVREDNDEEYNGYRLGRSDALSVEEYEKQRNGNYLSWNPTVGNNSVFVVMNDEQKEELGGVEYRAMKTLCSLLVFYYVGIHLFGIVFLVPMAVKNKKYADIIRADGVSPTWWAIFLSMSAIANLGYGLTPDSLLSMYQSSYILMVSSIFIFFGNSGFPVALRGIIYVLKKFSSPLTMRHQSLSFLLDHPRRCFTMLFPGPANTWLVIVLFSLLLSYWILFIILDISSTQFDYMTKGQIVFNALFQSFSSRTAGLASFNMGQMNPCMQLLTIVMMYIALLPIAMSVRSTNVYEDQSLGIFGGAVTHENVMSRKKWEHEILKVNIRNQLSFDMWFLTIVICLICICEAGSINEGKFGIFDIMFEVVSGYGTVGLSMGFSGIDSSLATKFSNLSKLLVCLVMIRGRHRGLPVSLDRSIMLSGRKMDEKDEIGVRHALRQMESERSSQLADVISRKEAEEMEEVTATKSGVAAKVGRGLFITCEYVLHFVWSIFIIA